MSRYARWIAALAVTVSGLLHLKMWFNGVRDESVGPAFMLNAVGGIVIAVLLLTWQHWLPPLLTVGFGISTLGAFTIAATVGLFGVHEQWVGGYVWTAAISEAVAIVAGVAALLPALPQGSSWVHDPRGGGRGVTSVVPPSGVRRY